MNEPREVIFHQSTNRPQLLLGCDRELTLFSIFVCALVATAFLFRIWGMVVHQRHTQHRMLYGGFRHSHNATGDIVNSRETKGRLLHIKLGSPFLAA